MHCIGGLKHCVWFPADKLTSGDLLTANSTEADTELGAWRQPERGGGCWGRFVGRERRGTERQTDGRKDSERVSMWWNRKQVETHRKTDQYGGCGGVIDTQNLAWLKILFFWWSIRKWKKMAASYKDLINFEGSSAPLVQGRVQEGGKEGGRQTPGLIRIHCR